ncbi:cytochrome c oxidase subunit 3 [Planctomyces sp. SH-PL62]|uniref:cytochrome c oxidase subunit 3 n=1 Tax=Planctomyces sp. SH-PL62 TaxID=1636152 RepID=UPI00078E4C8A|nr:cytochrome c oxidase subunit 3 [Planctomyces sp. SH-PL62]AMV40901.1 Cytochrome c oxidase subunit 3 [Planctomyces sp. SH-PL62]
MQASTSTMPDEGRQILSSHFDDLEQQHLSSNLGMWFFLGSEVMFFSGLIVSYAVYRGLSPVAFELASRHMDLWVGFFNTLVLLTSSLTMAFAVRCSQVRDNRGIVRYLIATAVLGSAFLGVKATEYKKEIDHHLFPGPHFVVPGHDAEEMLEASKGPDGQVNHEVYRHNLGRFQMMFVFYFFMTGVHAFHMIVGIAAVLIFAVLAKIRWFSGYGHTQIEALGLYWHFVDVVWVFLYPLLYLIG